MSPHASPSETAEGGTTVYKLDNGMTVVIREDHFAPVVALQVWVKAGGADENDIEAGVAHVHEHMLFKGTKKRGVGEIAAEVESSGGRINAWTSWNETVYHIVVASRYADTGLDVLADAVRNSSFDPTELDKELAVVMEEWKRGEDSPSRKVFNGLFGSAYQVHPYKRPVIGTKESIEGLTRERVLDFFGRYYAPNNMTLIVVGDVDTKHMEKVVAKAFAGFDAREIPRPERQPEPPQREVRFDTITMRVQEAQMALGFHIPGADDPDAPILDLLSFVLGGGESSRLYRRLVAESQLATAAGAFAYTPPDPGLFVITASLEAADARKAYDAIISEVAKLRAKPVTAEELDRARTNLESDFVFRNETVQGQARELGYAITIHNDPDYDKVYLDRLRRATVADLQAAAQRYLQRDNLTVVQLLPEGASQRLNAAVAKQDAVALTAPVDAPAAMTATSVRAVADATAATNGGQSGAKSTDKHEPTLLRLDNGVRVIVAEHHDVPVFSVHAAMLGGVLAETPKTNGISSFTAEMLTRGTTERSRERLARDIESMAASISGFSGHNSLGVSGTFLSQDFDRGLDLLVEVLRKPAFDPAEVEKARREILLAIKNRDDNTSTVAFDLAYATVYPDHPYGMTTLGETGSIDSLRPADLRSFYKRALNPQSLVIAIVGDVDTTAVAKKLGVALIDLESTQPPFEIPSPAPEPTKIRYGLRETERHQSHIVLGYPSVTVSDPDRYPLAVLDNILSGQSGRLFNVLRDQQSLAYSVTAFLTKGLARGIFGGYIATDPANTERAVNGLLEQFELVRDDEVSRDELKRAQRYLIGSRDISLQTNGAMAEEMGFNELYGLGYLAGREYDEKILDVSVGDVQKVARKYLDPSIRAEVVVGPEAAVDAIKATEQN